MSNPRKMTVVEDQENRPDATQKGNEEAFTPQEIRQHTCRIANSVRLLSALGFPLSAEVIVETAEASMSSHIAIKDMLAAEFCVQTAEREVQRRLSNRS